MNIDFIKKINSGKFLQTSYIFESQPDPEGSYRFLAILFGALIITAVILIIRLKEKEKIYKKLNSKIINLFLFTGFLGLILIFFRWQGIPYLGSRLMLMILAAVFIIWGLTICWYKFRILPKELEEYQKQKIFEKYLP